MQSLVKQRKPHSYVTLTAEYFTVKTRGGDFTKWNKELMLLEALELMLVEECMNMNKER